MRQFFFIITYRKIFNKRYLKTVTKNDKKNRFLLIYIPYIPSPEINDENRINISLFNKDYLLTNLVSARESSILLPRIRPTHHVQQQNSNLPTLESTPSNLTTPSISIEGTVSFEREGGGVGRKPSLLPLPHPSKLIHQNSISSHIPVPHPRWRRAA